MLATIVAGAVLLSGCSRDPQHQAGADESAADQRTGELRIGITGPISADPATLNPTHAMDALAVDLLYDGLTAMSAGDLEAIPALASSWDTADGVVWTFHLDPDRRFSDGRTIDAEAVVASLERVRGLKESSLGAGRLDIVSSVTAIDPGTVQIVLSSANYELPAVLADPTYGVVGETTAVPTMASQTPVSGRFRVQSGGSDAATLVATDGKGVDIDAVEFVHFDTTGAAAAALADGKIDVAPLDASTVAPDGSRALTVPSATLVLEIGSANGILADAANRQLVLHALGRDALKASAGGDGSDSIVPGGIMTGDCAWCGGARDGVSDLTALAGEAPVAIDQPLGAGASAVAGAIATQLSTAGLPAQVRPTDPAGLQSTLAAGSLQMALFTLVGSAPTPDPYLAGALSSIGSENLSGYASAEFDTGLAEARATPDAAARRTAYTQVEASALAAAPVVPLASLGERFAVAERVGGVQPYAGLLFDITKVHLD